MPGRDNLRALRERPDELAAAVALTPYSRAEWRACRYETTPADDDVEAARRYLIEIDQSFSREGTGWSPPSIDRRGRWRAGVWQNLPEKLQAAATRLAGIALENSDAIDLIARYDQPDAVIYCDPPYPAGQRLAPDKGYRHDDTGDLWPRLVAALAEVQHAAVLLSGYHPCDPVDALGWRRVDLAHTRTVQARAGGTLSAAPGEHFEKSKGTIVRIENGERTLKDYELERIGTICGLPIEFFTMDFRTARRIR